MMSYFFKTIGEDNKKFRLFTAWFAAGVIAMVDLTATPLNTGI